MISTGLSKFFAIGLFLASSICLADFKIESVDVEHKKVTFSFDADKPPNRGQELEFELDNTKKDWCEIVVVRVDEKEAVGRASECHVLAQLKVGTELVPLRSSHSADTSSDVPSVGHSKSSGSIKKSHWAFDLFGGTGSVAIGATSSNGGTVTTAAGTASTTVYGLNLSFNKWIHDWYLILPEMTYSPVRVSQSGVSVSGSMYDLGFGGGYLFAALRFKLYAELLLGGASFPARSAYGSGYKIGGEYYFGPTWGVTLGYSTLGLASTSVSTGSSTSFSGGALAFTTTLFGLSFGF